MRDEEIWDIRLKDALSFFARKLLGAYEHCRAKCTKTISESKMYPFHQKTYSEKLPSSPECWKLTCERYRLTRRETPFV